MIFELPPRAEGTPEEQLSALRDYLVRLTRSIEQSATESPEKGASASKSARRTAASSADEKNAKEIMAQASALKALIVKNAKIQATDKAELMQSIESIEGTTLLHIDSSRGTVFKHNAVSTVLRVVIYRGGERITDAAAMRAAFGAGARLQWSWQRVDEDRFGLISASDSRLSEEGFAFTLGPNDVDVKVTFACELRI